MNQHNVKERSNGWIATLWRHLQGSGTEDDFIRQTTDHVVQVADPVIRQAKGYRKVLRDPITGAMEYCKTLISTIPGPVVLDRNRYYDDPVVKALFASPDELDEVLQLSPEINALRNQGQTGEMVALLTMTQQERSIFGHKQEGEMLLREVRQQAVSFSDHRIVGAATDLNTARAGIADRGIEVLATAAMERITTLRAEKAEMEGKKEYLKGMVKILGGQSYRQGMFAVPTVKNRDELRKVEQLLSELNGKLEEVRSRIALPEDSLGYLEEIMRQPEKILLAHSQSFRLNWMGVRVDDEPASEGNTITLTEFSMEDQQRSAILVAFSLGATTGP